MYSPAFSLSTTTLCVNTSVKWRAKQLRRRREKENDKRKLTSEDIMFIRENTKMKRSQIQAWFKNFLKSCPTAQLTKREITDQVAKVFPKGAGEAIADIIFQEFDVDSSGWLDFPEFLVAIHNMTDCTPTEQLRWIFRMVDTNRSGTIEMRELVELFGTFYLHERIDPHKAVRRAVKAFSVLDENKDLHISEEEFIRGCLEDKQIVQLIQ